LIKRVFQTGFNVKSVFVYKKPADIPAGFFCGFKFSCGLVSENMTQSTGLKSGPNDRITQATEAQCKIEDVDVQRFGPGGCSESEKETIELSIIRCVQLKKLHQVRSAHLVDDTRIPVKWITGAVERKAGRIITLFQP
jgi:hypothetical protein